MAATERVQGFVAHVRPSRNRHRPNSEVILVTFKLHGKDNSTEFHVPPGQYSVGETFPVYIRNNKASLT